MKATKQCVENELRQTVKGESVKDICDPDNNNILESIKKPPIKRKKVHLYLIINVLNGIFIGEKIIAINNKE